jgi:precorrin isomerase
VAALEAGGPVIVDVRMTGAGVSGVHADCYLDQVAAPPVGLTRSAAAMRIAASQHPTGAIVVVGCAPTALDEVLELAGRGEWAPALVIGLPVGFVGAAAAKEALRMSGLPAISNVGEKGGSAVAAAAVNALVRLAHGS